MITNFEEFLQRIIASVFSMKPMALKSSEKQMSYAEILNEKNHSKLTDKMIEKEVKDLLKKDIESINKYLIKNFKLDLSKQKNWKQFKECFSRRHILIHNNIYPDEQYRKDTGYKGKYTRLQIEKLYLDRSISLYRKFGKIVNDFIVSKYS